MSQDVYCMWNEYSGEFDITNSSYVNYEKPEPLQTLVWSGRLKESDFLNDNEYEDYPQGPYIHSSPPSSPPLMYIPKPLIQIPSFVLNDMSTWTCLTPIKEDKKEEQPQTLSTHSWSPSTWKEGFNMRTDPETIERFKNENKLTMSFDNMDKALYSVYMNQTEHKTFYTLLHKYSSMSYTASQYMRWRIETEPMLGMEDLESALQKKAPDGWKDMRKADLIKTIKKMVGSDVTQYFKWENLWCDIPTSKGPGFINYGYLINNISKKTKPQGRLLNTPSTPARSQNQPNTSNSRSQYQSNPSNFRSQHSSTPNSSYAQSAPSNPSQQQRNGKPNNNNRPYNRPNTKKQYNNKNEK